MDTESHSSGDNIELAPCMRVGDNAKICAAIPIISDADRSDSSARTPSPDAEGRVRHAVAAGTANTGVNGRGVADEFTHTIDQVQGQAVAFREPCPTLTAKMQGSSGWAPANEDAHLVGVAFAFAQNQLGEVRVNSDVMGTVNQNASGRNTPMIQSAMQVRRLCPAECEALQGFPVGYTDVPYRKKPAADGPRYRALGNSMAVPCMWWLGHRISQATTPRH